LLLLEFFCFFEFNFSEKLNSMLTTPQLGNDLLGLFYPRLCLACGNPGQPKQVLICLKCLSSLPFTNYHLDKENPLTERFWGRLPIETGAAMLHFVKAGRVQHLIHALKYEGKKEVGQYLGKMYGGIFKKTPHFENIDLILPIPLHPRRQHQRGYNQSACIAEGMAEGMGIPWLDGALMRARTTETQTRKNRLDRVSNVAEVFQVANSQLLMNKHILLVDDVMTTGATLEACGEKILEIPGVKLSVATLAIADF
jgi:ComF family protein